MVSTFTPNLGYEMPGDGNSGWGAALNTNLGNIDTHVGTQHKADGTHGPKVTITQTSSVEEALIVSQSGDYYGARLYQTGQEQALRIEKSSTGPDTALMVFNTGSGPGVQIAQKGNGYGLLIDKTNTGAQECARINNYGGNAAVHVQQLTTDAVCTFIEQDTNAIGLLVQKTNSTSNTINAQFSFAGAATNVYIDKYNAEGTALYIDKDSTGGFNAVQLDNAGTGPGLEINAQGNGIGLKVNSSATSNPLLVFAPNNANTRGDIAFGALRTADPGSPAEGDVWYNATANTLYLYNGSSTIDLGAVGGGGTIGGSGTTNRVAKFTAGTTIGDSNITDTGAAITLGSNTTVSGTLSVSSNATISGKLTVTGGVDPDYMQLTPQTKYDHIPESSLFVDGNDDNKLKFLDQDKKVWKVNMEPSQFGA